MEDGDDIEAIYNQEREREMAATGGEGDVEQASREPHGSGEQSGEQSSSKQLSARVKAFLDKCNSVKSQNTESAGSGPTKICDTVKNLKQQMLDAPGLHGGVYSISADTGCFKLSSEAWGVPPFEKSIFGQRKNLSFSFDPATMVCGCCPDQHQVLDSVRGGGRRHQKFLCWPTSPSRVRWWCRYPPGA
jgi:hypothetical protein